MIKCDYNWENNEILLSSPFVGFFDCIVLEDNQSSQFPPQLTPSVMVLITLLICTTESVV